MSELNLSEQQIDYLLTPLAIRERAAAIFASCEKGQTHFAYVRERLKPTVDYVLQVIRKNYPDMQIPFHSRWGHFRAGGRDRVAELDRKLASFDVREIARSKLDLVVASVLLDAGAGERWSYNEDGKTYTRSEGLGVASYRMFLAGAMSGDGKSLRADSAGLKKITSAILREHFQVGEKNPLVGVDGRVALLTGLAGAVENQKFFPGARPGGILDLLAEKYDKTIPAPAILQAVLHGFGSIWPGRLHVRGINLGDVWKYAPLGEGFHALVPIHKLSQWMTYSLIQPIQEAGFEVTDVEKLTGLAEYRNGGLLIDSGVLSLRDPADSQKSWPPDSALIVEWRALTVHLLDLIGAEVQKALGKRPSEFPLAKVLEGGTWWAGRFLAREKRPDGTPPLNIQSDGTVF
jgi:hypothetical protein